MYLICWAPGAESPVEESEAALVQVRVRVLVQVLVLNSLGVEARPQPRVLHFKDEFYYSYVTLKQNTAWKRGLEAIMVVTKDGIYVLVSKVIARAGSLLLNVLQIKIFAAEQMSYWLFVEKQLLH